MQNGVIQKLLLEPYKQGRLKKETIDLLSDPGLYWSAYLAIYSKRKPEEESFECLIHNLAKNGGYVLESDDVVVNGSMLAKKKPFREVSESAMSNLFLSSHLDHTVPRGLLCSLLA